MHNNTLIVRHQNNVTTIPINYKLYCHNLYCILHTESTIGTTIF